MNAVDSEPHVREPEQDVDSILTGLLVLEFYGGMFAIPLMFVGMFVGAPVFLGGVAHGMGSIVLHNLRSRIRKRSVRAARIAAWVCAAVALGFGYAGFRLWQSAGVFAAAPLIGLSAISAVTWYLLSTPRVKMKQA